MPASVLLHSHNTMYAVHYAHPNVFGTLQNTPIWRRIRTSSVINKLYERPANKREEL